MKKKVTAKLEINITYSDRAELSKSEYESILRRAAEYLYSEGLLTPDDADVTADNVEHDVTVSMSGAALQKKWPA